MLEFVVVYFLARKNGQIVEEKGISGTKYRWGTAGLWFGCEILGVILGLVILGDAEDVSAAYFFGLVGAVVGAVLAYYWAKSAAPNLLAGWFPTHRTPAAGLQAWAAPDPSQQPILMIPPNVDLVLLGTAGEWAQVRAFNGFVAWVDAKLLVGRYGTPAFQSPIAQG